MIKVVVIGSNGYIGQHIVHKLTQNNAIKLYLYDVQSESTSSLHSYQQLNLIQPIDQQIKKELSEADFIFFFSGLTGTIKSVAHYSDFIEVNELGLLKVLDCIKDQDKKPKIIFPSTRLVYKGVKDALLTEDAEKEYKTIYAVNKFACEQYLSIYNNLYNIPYVVLRICVPYGNLLGNQLSFGTLSFFIEKAQAGENITLFGDGQLKRTFTHVDDITELITLAAMTPTTNNQIFNIGSNDNISLYDVASSIAKIYSVKIEFTDFSVVDTAIESGDTMFDGSKLCKLLNYSYKNTFTAWVNNL